jgi:hypothetical protein
VKESYTSPKAFSLRQYVAVGVLTQYLRAGIGIGRGGETVEAVVGERGIARHTLEAIGG